MISSMVSSDAVGHDNDRLYEVLDGRRTEAGPMGTRECRIATLLACDLESFARERRLGLTIVENLFELGLASGNQRRPDLAFVSQDRWPATHPVPDSEAWEVVPDLAIEIVSRSNASVEVLAKLTDYFSAGVRQVWLVYPDARQIYVYDSPTVVRIVTVGDRLGDVPALPGFTLDVAHLFATIS